MVDTSRWNTLLEIEWRFTLNVYPKNPTVDRKCQSGPAGGLMIELQLPKACENNGPPRLIMLFVGRVQEVRMRTRLGGMPGGANSTFVESRTE